MKRMIKYTVLTFALTLVSVAAFAQPVSTTNAADNISATVIQNCRIQNFSLAFGNYDPTAAANLDAQTTFDVRCTKNTAATIALDLGVNTVAGVRQLTDGTDNLAYRLYSDALRTTEWTDTATVAYNAATNAWVTQTIYGRIAAGQDVGAGSYFDTVQATINW